MTFIKQQTASSAPGKEEESTTLITKMWQHLEGEERKGVDSDNLRTFVGAIMKILFSPDVHVEPSGGIKTGGFTSEGVYVLDQGQAEKVHKEFILFYLNRTAYSTPSSAKPIEDSEYTFKPSLCEKSVSMASSVREKYTGEGKESKADSSSRVLHPNEHVEILTQIKKEQEQ